MKLQLVRSPRRLPGWPWLPLALAAYAVGMGLITWLAQRLGRDVVLCPFKRVTRLPCPVCGTARGGVLLLRGRVGEAFASNPLVLTIVLAAFAILLLRVTAGLAVRVHLSRRERIAAWCVLSVLVAANWAYVVVLVG